jgi:hypothetical protein
MEENRFFPQSVAWIEQLEEAVADAERALRARDWYALDSANRRQPRLIHGLRNALELERSLAPEEENRKMDGCIEQILAVRAGQIERLRTFREEIRRRLIELDRFRRAAQGAAARRKRRSTFDIVR